MNPILHSILILLLIYGNETFAQLITVNKIDVKNGDKVDVCEGEALTLKVKSPVAGKKYRWKVPGKASTTIKRHKDLKNETLSLAKAQADFGGEYELITKDKGFLFFGGGSKMREKFTVSINKAPAPLKLQYYLPARELVVIDESQNALTDYTYEWTKPDKVTYGMSAKEVRVSSPGISDLGVYKVKVEDKKTNCSVTGLIEIIVPKKISTDSTAATPKKSETNSSSTKKDNTQKEWSFIGSIGGNIDMSANPIKLRINTVYTDIQIKHPPLTIAQNLLIRFPVRFFFNNGIGPTVNERGSPQEFFTIDQETLASQGKIRYWRDRANLFSKTEIRNLGLNIPITFVWQLLGTRFPGNKGWSILCGINAEYAEITNRITGYEYVKVDSAMFTVDRLDQVPIPPPVSYTTITGDIIMAATPVRFQTTPYRPPVPASRTLATYSQLYLGMQFGAEFESEETLLSFKYSYGGTLSFIDQRRTFRPSNYNHILQLIFVEKNLGLQLFADLRLGSIKRTENPNYFTTTAIPYYYLSVSKQINLSKIKELLFP